jgi:hypothetical protein
MDSMSNCPTKEAGANLVGSISKLCRALKPKGLLFALHPRRYSVENLVENKDEMRAQATEENCWSLSLPHGFTYACH